MIVHPQTTPPFPPQTRSAPPVPAPPLAAAADKLPVDKLKPPKGFKIEVYASGIDLDLETLRSEEHTSELQSHLNLVCRLLLEKKKRNREYRIERTTAM